MSGFENLDAAGNKLVFDGCSREGQPELTQTRVRDLLNSAAIRVLDNDTSANLSNSTSGCQLFPPERNSVSHATCLLGNEQNVSEP